MRPLSLCLAAAVLLSSSSAFADPPAAAPAPAPAAPFVAGCDVQRAAFRADAKPSAARALVLADCTQMESPREAAALLAPLLREGAATADEKTRAEQLLAIVRARVASVSLEVDRHGAEVAVDGTPVGLAPLPEMIFVSPGRHVFTAKSAEGRTARQEIDLSAGQVAGFMLRTVPLQGDIIGYDLASGNAAPPAPGTERSPALIVAGAAVGVAALGTGIVFHLLANGRASSAADAQSAIVGQTKNSGACGSPTPAVAGLCAGLHGDLAARDHLSNIALGAYVIAGMAAAATIAYAFWPVTQEHRQTFAARPAPLIGPGLGGFAIAGQF